MEGVINWGGTKGTLPPKVKGVKPQATTRIGRKQTTPAQLLAVVQARGDKADEAGTTDLGVQPPDDGRGAVLIDSPHKLRNKDLTKLRSVNEQPPMKRHGGGWPKGRPRLFTPEVIEALCNDLLAYADENEYPTEAEYCYTRGINFQRLNDIPALREAKDMMLAKRQAMLIRRGMTLTIGEGPLGAFISRMISHAGQFSMTEKQELTHAGSIGVQIVDDI